MKKNDVAKILIGEVGKMPRKELKTPLPSADDLLFTTQEERDDMQREKIVDVAISLIDDFPNHPYQVRIDDEMRELVETVREHGVLSPAIARPKEAALTLRVARCSNAAISSQARSD